MKCSKIVMLEECAKTLKNLLRKLLNRFWKDFVTETDNSTEQFYEPNGNPYREYNTHKCQNGKTLLIKIASSWSNVS